VSEFPAPFMQKKRLALMRRFYLRPFLLPAGIFLAISYACLWGYPHISGWPPINDFADAIARLIPTVRNAPQYSTSDAASRFVMSVQWLSVPFYAWVLFVGYCPFSMPTRVAVHGWYKRTYISHKKGGLFMAGIFFCVYVLAEIGIVKLPTMINGRFFPLDQAGGRLRYFVGIMNSPIVMPAFAWFAPFATVCIYWGILHYAVNFRMIVATNPRSG
jgi:hypothetical protein